MSAKTGLVCGHLMQQIMTNSELQKEVLAGLEAAHWVLMKCWESEPEPQWRLVASHGWRGKNIHTVEEEKDGSLHIGLAVVADILAAHKPALLKDVSLATAFKFNEPDTVTRAGARRMVGASFFTEDGGDLLWSNGKELCPPPKDDRSVAYVKDGGGNVYQIVEEEG